MRYRGARTAFAHRSDQRWGTDLAYEGRHEATEQPFEHLAARTRGTEHTR